MTDECGFCGSRQAHEPVAAAKCAYRYQLRQKVRKRGQDTGIDPAACDDLWAHLGTIYDEGTLALDTALTVIDLGWRPQVSA